MSIHRSRGDMTASSNTSINDTASWSDSMEDIIKGTHVNTIPTTGDNLNPKRELLSLSDEILELIVQQVDRHDDIPNLRLASKKLLRLSERHMYRNFVVTLPEEVDPKKWREKLETMPDSIKMIKYLTIMNQSIGDNGYFYDAIVPMPHSHRILRWGILEQTAHSSRIEFENAAFFKGSKFRWNVRLEQNQLISFRWRHATTLSYELLCKIMTAQAGSLQELELTMITPPSANSVDHFTTAIQPKIFPKLKKLTYNGLSHTEPIPQNMPARGGRFRMLRPLFRKTYETLEELALSQDHCISQVGKTPLINGRTFNSFLCDLDDIYNHREDPCPTAIPTVTLNLRKLELGGFRVETLFDAPTILTAAPRVRLNLSTLEGLVLNECDRIGTLFRELALRKQELRLKEVGFRIKEQREDNHTSDWGEVAESLHEFLMSFHGLHTLSILWHGHNAPEAKDFSDVLGTHHKTLQVYSFATRTSSNLDYRFTVQPSSMPSPWMDVHSAKTRPELREIGFDLPDQLCTKGYPALRLLSQFKTLRTAHIRHFPAFFTENTSNQAQYWRVEGGAVPREASNRAAQFAELIALPYFGLSPDEDTVQDTGKNADSDNEAETEGSATDSSELRKEPWSVFNSFKLEELAKMHAAVRDDRLQPGFTMISEAIQTSTPVTDPTYRVLRHRADSDFRFAHIMHKVQLGTATTEESKTYERFSSRVRKHLGLTKPYKNDKPKLRLLVVGDWRYRDQLNLAGPRTWNPQNWTAPQNVQRYADDNFEDDEDVDPYRSDTDEDLYMNPLTRLRPGFLKEFDVSLRPIFFKITWKAVQDDKDSKWRWKAKATPLPQSTLEGYGWLGDVKSLDFAWQN